MDDNTVRSWGYNGKGQLGVGNIKNVGDGPDEMGDNMVVTELGTDITPSVIHAGGWHTCAIVNTDKLKCWGELRVVRGCRLFFIFYSTKSNLDRDQQRTVSVPTGGLTFCHDVAQKEET